MRRAVFLDRDGTLIVGEGYLGDPAGVVPCPGARDALDRLGERGWLRLVVTNQSGVARGLFTADQYRAVEAEVARALPGVDATYACFHLPGGVVAPWNTECACRKPLPGLLERAAAEWDVDLAASVLVGDDLRDLQAARAAGVRPVLVRTGKGRRTEERLADAGLDGVEVVDDLPAFVRALEGATRAAAEVLLDRDELVRRLESERAAGRTIVLANGCFDLLHVGHVRYLRGAAVEGDVLVVALNSDDSVRRNKGAGRPLVGSDDRVEVIAALRCVDYVTVFDEPTADDLIRALRPDVHAKGTDWTAEAVPEAATVREIGGRVAIVGDEKSRSTTGLLERARTAAGDATGDARGEGAPEAG